MVSRYCWFSGILWIGLTAAAFGQPLEEATLPEVLVRPSLEPTEPVSPPTDTPVDFSPVFTSPFSRTLQTGGLDEKPLFDLPGLATVRTRQRIEEMAPLTTPEALQEEVGVLIQRTNLGGGSVFVRGLTGNQVLILVDGIRLNNSTFRFGPNQYLNTIDPGQIERIEVVRGPQAVLYGSDAIGGVVNVITRSAAGIGSGPGIGGSFAQRFSSSDTGLYSRGNVEATFRRSGIFVGGSYLDRNDLDPGGSTPRQDFTGYEQSAADLKFDSMIDQHNMFTVGIQHLVQHDVPRTDKFVNSNESFIFDPQQRDLYYLRWQGTGLGRVVDAYRITASFQRQQEGLRRQKFGNPTLRRSFDDVQTTGVELMAASDLGMFGRLTYGTQWYYDEIDSRRVDIDTNTQTVTPGRASFPDDSRYNRLGFFLQNDLAVTQRLRATGGVRYTSINAGATPLVGQAETPTPIEPFFQDWTGSVGLVYELSPCVHVVGTVSEGFRAPGLDDLTALRATNQGVDIPSPNLGAETSWNYEVGLKTDFERFQGQIFGFWTDLNDLIVRVPAGFQIDGTDAFVKRNVAKAEMDGLELTGRYLVAQQWSLYGNLAYVFGRDLTQNEPMSRIPPAQGIFGLRWRGEGGCRWFEIYEWMVARQDRLSARDQDDPRIPVGGTAGYHTLNLRSGMRVGHNGKLTLGLENILDRHYRIHGSGIDAPGITLTLGYELFR